MRSQNLKGVREMMAYTQEAWQGLDLSNLSVNPNTGSFLELDNMIMNDNGKWETRTGFTKIVQGLPTIENIQGVFCYANKMTDGSIKREIILVANGRIYKHNMDTPLTIFEDSITDNFAALSLDTANYTGDYGDVLRFEVTDVLDATGNEPGYLSVTVTVYKNGDIVKNIQMPDTAGSTQYLYRSAEYDYEGIKINVETDPWNNPITVGDYYEVTLTTNEDRWIDQNILVQTSRKVNFKQFGIYLFIATGSKTMVYNGNDWKDITSLDNAYVPKTELNQPTELGYNIAHPHGSTAVAVTDPNADAVTEAIVNVQTVPVRDDTPNGEPSTYLYEDKPVNVVVTYEGVENYQSESKTINFINEQTRSDYEISDPYDFGFKVTVSTVDIIYKPALVIYYKKLTDAGDTDETDLQLKHIEFLDTDVSDPGDTVNRLSGTAYIPLEFVGNGDFKIDVKLMYLPHQMRSNVKVEVDGFGGNNWFTIDSGYKRHYVDKSIYLSTNSAAVLVALNNSYNDYWTNGYAESWFDSYIPNFGYGYVEPPTNMLKYHFNPNMPLLNIDAVDIVLGLVPTSDFISYWKLKRTDNNGDTTTISKTFDKKTTGSTINSKTLNSLHSVMHSFQILAPTANEAVSSDKVLSQQDLSTCNLIEVFKGRIYLAGSLTAPRVIFSSDVINLDYFPSLLANSFISTKLENITTLKQRRNSLMIPTKTEFPILVGDSAFYGDPNLFQLNVLYPDVGVLAPRTLRFVDDTLVYLSNEGVKLSKPSHIYQDTVLSVKSIDSVISKLINKDPNSFAFFKNGRYYLLYPDKKVLVDGEPDGFIGLIYDVRHGGVWSRMTTKLDAFVDVFEYGGDTYLVSDDGTVYLFDEDVYTDDTELIKITMTPNNFVGDLSFKMNKKSFKYGTIRLNIDDTKNIALDVAFFINGIDLKQENTYQVNRDAEGNIIGVSVFENSQVLDNSTETVPDELVDTLVYRIHQWDYNLSASKQNIKGDAITFKLTGDVDSRVELIDFGFSARIKNRVRKRVTVYAQK